MIRIPREVTTNRRGPKVIVDRGDGNLFRMSEHRASLFVRQTPGAFIVDGNETQTEQAEPEGLNRFTVAELKQLASEYNVEIDSKARKPEIITALEEAGVTGDEDEDEDDGN